MTDHPKVTLLLGYQDGSLEALDCDQQTVWVQRCLGDGPVQNLSVTGREVRVMQPSGVCCYQV